MIKDWLLRVGDGEHFKKSSSKHIWGVDSKAPCSISFLKSVNPGDHLWFVLGKSGGKLLAVATFSKTKLRELGPLINFTATNEELGWTNKPGEWDIEVHFENLYWIDECNLQTKIQSPLVIRQYNAEKCKVELPTEYTNILKYSKVRTTNISHL